ncbi:unnamed protein product [Bursaphelenchus okinawaensis]|uniref:Uncharacterized protein n=1 Tax=Bursaphelenchus okinawaensis TaxID=465554 RepID=A0A811KBZ4_9BILA|nr:unnamed protein product [Bursaphelenchus okinawaensis]CAG9098673.1 unnamed protein product [Bursaphelenchus okinawaensis]
MSEPRSDRNKMGLLGAVSFVCGNIIGSGLFITPTAILQYTNSVGLSLLVWFLSALISMLGAYCYIELGTSIRHSGADFAYLCYVGWFPIAFSFLSTGCLMTFPAVVAVEALTFSEYLFEGLYINLESAVSQHMAKTLASFSLVWLICFLNFFSLRTFVSRFQIAATAAKILATMTIICVGMYMLVFKGEVENLKDPFANSTYEPSMIVNAFFQGLFSYDGWDVLNFGVEEVANPTRTLSLAIPIGIFIIAFVYCATNLSYFVVLSIPEVLKTPAVAQTFANRTMGSFRHAMPFLTSIMLIGSLNSTIFTSSRYLFAGARQGQMPSFLSVVNEKHDSPRAAIFYSVLLAMLFALVGEVDKLINYLTFAMWVQRALTMCALLYIRYYNVKVHPDRIRVPIILPIVFLIICITLVITTVTADIKTASIGLVFLITGFVFYMVFLWDKGLARYDGYKNSCARVDEKLAIYNQIIFNGMVSVNKKESMFENKTQLLTDSPSATPIIHH